MPITHAYDARRQVVSMTASGTLTAADFGAYCEAILADPTIEAGFVETVVIHPEAHILITFRDLLPFAGIWRRYLEKGCIGTLILAQSPAGYGVFRMFAVAINSEDADPEVGYELVESAEELNSGVAELCRKRARLLTGSPTA